MTNKQLAEEILQKVGGKKNITSCKLESGSSSVEIKECIIQYATSC